MATDTFNGASLTFASATVGPLRSITSNEAGAKADTTGSADSVKTYGIGIPDASVTCEVLGGTTLSVGDEGALAVAWGDIGGSTDGTIAAATVVSVSTTGAMDGEITSTIEFCTSAPTS